MRRKGCPIPYRLVLARKEIMKPTSPLMDIARGAASSKYGLILIYIAISLVVGLFIVDDFGLSWDEFQDVTYGKVVLDAYQGSEDFIWEGRNRRFYGPFYWMSLNLFTQAFENVRAGWMYVDLWKVGSFFIFQVSVFLIYRLSLRYLKKGQALFTAILFSTQPLLFGHAFINQKDIPFMTFFLASVLLGVLGVDAFHKRLVEPHQASEGHVSTFKGAWRVLRGRWISAGRRGRRLLVMLIALLILSTLELFLLRLIVLPGLQALLRQAYQGTALKPLNQLFNRIAQDAYKTPLELYLQKLQSAYFWGAVLFLFILVVLLYFLSKKVFCEVRAKPGTVEWVKALVLFLIAGVVLGLTISIRVGGPFAGFLVSMYFLLRSKHKSFEPLILYWGIAFVIMFATWPFLWKAPLDHFIESLRISAGFSHRETLFQGIRMPADQMPWYYLPLLFFTQFTEPIMILFLAGLVMALVGARKGRLKARDILLLLLWIGVPIIGVILFKTPVYDNFRQFLFITPALFVIAGLGFQSLYQRLKPTFLRGALTVLVLFPGLIGIFKYHPYEYAYYNLYMGRMGAVYQTYEFDYWCTSLREAIGFLNKTAPPNSTVVILGPKTAAIPFGREDLKIGDGGQYGEDPDFAVACRYGLWSDDFYPEYESIYRVRRGEGILAEVKARP
jgi:hypothetical protein